MARHQRHRVSSLLLVSFISALGIGRSELQQHHDSRTDQSRDNALVSADRLTETDLHKLFVNFGEHTAPVRKLGSGSGSGGTYYGGSGSGGTYYGGSGSGNGGTYYTGSGSNNQSYNSNNEGSSGGGGGVIALGDTKGGGIKAKSVGAKIPAPPIVQDVSDCGDDDEFHAYVLVEHSLVDGNKIDKDVMEVLEDTFRDTYNTLNAPRTNQAVCDKNLMRFVDKVEVFAKDNIYVQMEGQKLARRNFLYKVEGRCDGCDKDTPLFGVAPRRKETTIFEIVDDPTPTGCRCYPRGANDRAPTEVEFRDAFRKNIKALEARGTITNIKTSDKVIEYETVGCEWWKEKMFETEMEIDLSEAPEEENIGQLEDGFQNSYNKLATSYCDPNYRFVTHVTVEEVDNVYVRLLKNETVVDKKKRKRRKKRYRVKGRCRGCKKETSLFNDGSDLSTKAPKRNLRSSSMDEHNQSNRQEFERKLFPYALFDLRHVFDGKDICFCALRPQARRAPTEEEFLAKYNQVLTAGNSRGYVTQPITAVEIETSDD